MEDLRPSEDEQHLDNAQGPLCEDDGVDDLVEDARGTSPPVSVEQRTKIIFSNTSDDDDDDDAARRMGDAEGLQSACEDRTARVKGPRVAVVQTSYNFTLDPTELEAGSSDEEAHDGVVDDDDTPDDGYNHFAPPMLFTGAGALQAYAKAGGGLERLGNVLTGDGDAAKRHRRIFKKRGRTAEQRVTDAAFLAGKRKRFIDDDDAANDDDKSGTPAGATATIEAAVAADLPLPAANEPIYNLTLVEADVQEVFSDAGSDEPGEPAGSSVVAGEVGVDEEDSDAPRRPRGLGDAEADVLLEELKDLDDEDFDDDEEEEELLERIVAVAAVAEAVQVIEEDPEFRDDRRYAAFATKAKELLKQLDEDGIDDIAFIEAMEPQMSQLKRLHARLMRPPRDAPIVVDGVVMDM